MEELTELEIKVINFLMNFGILPDRSNFKYTRELINLIKNHEPKQCAINGVVKSLQTKKYEIDFGGNVLAGLEITNNEPIVIGAMNGWGNGISKDEITITEK